MLNALSIRNFQSHKRASFEFHKGMNVITGTSDSGKSAVIRAIIWSLRNRPSGGAFKSWFATDTDDVAVDMEFDNGSFSKTRVGSKNKYITDNGSYEALRSDVPDEVLEISNVSEYNLQTQMQPYFMLQDSPGERAKQLNDLAGLSIIDTIFKKMNGRIQTTKSTMKRIEAEIEQVKSDITQFKDMTLLEKRLEKFIADCKEYDLNGDDISCLSDILENAESIDEQIRSAQEILKYESRISKILGMITELKKYQADGKELEAMVETFYGIEESMKKSIAILKGSDKLASINKQIKEYYTNSNDIVDLQIIIEDYQKIVNRVINQEDELQELISQYGNLLKSAKVCPLCSSDIKLSAIAEITNKMRG